MCIELCILSTIWVRPLSLNNAPQIHLNFTFEFVDLIKGEAALSHSLTLISWLVAMVVDRLDCEQNSMC